MSTLKVNKIQNVSGSDVMDVSTSGLILSTPSSISGTAIMDSEYIYTLNADRTIVATVVAATSYSMFGVGLIVPTGTYRVDIFGSILTGTTSHTVSFSLGGTATLLDTQFYVDFLNVANSTGVAVAGTPTAPLRTFFTANPTTVANGVVSPASTIASKSLVVSGIVRVNGQGTINPQIGFSANPTGTNAMAKGSYVRITPISTNITSNISYGTWA